ncbi:CD276 antigen-like [Limanda limanda]|uniref:CD276 antigen-like n=1 Tax=Limanda limanda TaxID=27771 RepID=UPI0029C993C5|nr:CD276 antigen-like [Limanda limanda]
MNESVVGQAQSSTGHCMIRLVDGADRVAVRASQLETGQLCGGVRCGFGQPRFRETQDRTHQGPSGLPSSSQPESHCVSEDHSTFDERPFVAPSCNKLIEVSCVLEESCILPCRFQPGTDPVIKWKKVDPGNPRLVSYYSARHQIELQNERFRGRTSMFTDQISRGNASIRLMGLQLQDQGRYECYTSTITGVREESFINLRADAPVRHVDIEQVEDSFTCRSEGIYPEPQLTWSTRPPSTVTYQNQTSVKRTEQQLYEISSTVTLSDRDTVLICSISTRSGWRSSVWYQPTPVHVSSFKTTTTIHCTAPNTKPPTHRVWKFNHSQIIVDQTGVDGPPRVSEQWRQQVEDVSASGSLTLHRLSSDHQGTFTCELSSEEETHFINRYVTIEEGKIP